MTPSRYFVIQCGCAWAKRSGNRTFGPFSDDVHAIAGKDGKAGRPAKVLLKQNGRKLRTRLMDATRPLARRAILQMTGPTGHISLAMTTPSQMPHVPTRRRRHCWAIRRRYTLRHITSLCGRREPDPGGFTRRPSPASFSTAQRHAAGPPDNPVERDASSSVSRPFPEWAEKNRSGISGLKRIDLESDYISKN
jgi:rRNA maturation protein Nop10